MHRDEALAKLHDLLPVVLARFGVASLAMFGSVARDEATETSDLDVLAELDDDVGLLGFVALKQYLEEALGVRVDVATRPALKPRMRDRILREAVDVA